MKINRSVVRRTAFDAGPGISAAFFCIGGLVVLAGCASLVQAVKNEECSLDATNPYDVVEVDLTRHDVRLYWKRPDGSLFSTIDAVRTWVATQGDSLIAATNAGIYEPGFVPSGLFIEGTEVKQQLNLDEGSGNFFLKPNGIFFLDDGGAHIVEASAFDTVRSVVRYGTQSGPLLLAGGAIHPAFTPGSENCRLRSGVGVSADNRVFLAITNGAVNFYDFARFFRDELGATDALFLDGGISELYAPALGRTAPGRQRFAVILAVLDR